jgi:hypothetical protein
MKRKIEKLLDNLFKYGFWQIVVSAMVLVFLGAFIFYSLNYFNPSLEKIEITKKEFTKNLVNEDLSEKDLIQSSATSEDYNKKLSELKAKLPKAEWKLTQKELSEDEYEAAKIKYREEYKRIEEAVSLYYAFTGNRPPYSTSDIPYPQKVEKFPYSMKGFLEVIMDSQEIDSTDFDSKINVIEKVEHFLSLTDKKGGDTLLVKKFQDILKNSKDLTLDEIKSVEQLHNSITKTKLVFSLTQPNSPMERQTELFELYQAAANSKFTTPVFEKFSELVTHLKDKSKLKDTVTILQVVKAVMNLDFSSVKEKDDVSKDIELECVNDFFYSGKFEFTDEDVVDKFSKHSKLYGQKLEKADLEKRAREILREENRTKAMDWMYFGFFFTCFATLIVLMVKLNSTINKSKNN